MKISKTRKEKEVTTDTIEKQTILRLLLKTICQSKEQCRRHLKITRNVQSLKTELEEIENMSRPNTVIKLNQ